MSASRDYGAELDALKEELRELRKIVSRIAEGGARPPAREPAGDRHAVSVGAGDGDGEATTCIA